MQEAQVQAKVLPTTVAQCEFVVLGPRGRLLRIQLLAKAAAKLSRACCWERSIEREREVSVGRAQGRGLPLLCSFHPIVDRKERTLAILEADERSRTRQDVQGLRK